MNNTLFTGTCTALVTPFIDGKINYPMMEQLLKRQIEWGIQAVVICGTTGEASTICDEEKETLFKCAKDYVKDRCLIIAGTGCNATKHTVELSQIAEKAGADALLVVSPYYNKANKEGLFTHYQTVAQNVSIPIIMYNVPTRTGVDIPVEIYKALSNTPNIAGVKEASKDITKLLRIFSMCPETFHVWSGNDDMIVPAMSLGAKGAISVLSNICPGETQAMCQAALAGDFDTAASLQKDLLPLIDLLFSDVNPIPVKAAMKMIGFDCGNCRLPLTELQEETYRRLTAYFS